MEPSRAGQPASEGQLSERHRSQTTRAGSNRSPRIMWGGPALALVVSLQVSLIHCGMVPFCTWPYFSESVVAYHATHLLPSVIALLLFGCKNSGPETWRDQARVAWC